MVNRQNDEIGILFYNHKTKNFNLFIKTYNNDGDVIKFITWLCGFSGSLRLFGHLLYPASFNNFDYNQFKYYFTFDYSEKKLYWVECIPKRSGGDEISKKELKLEFDPRKVHVPPIHNDPIEVTSDGIKFTLVKAIPDDREFSEKWHDFRDEAKLKTILVKAYEVSSLLYDIIDNNNNDNKHYL